MNVTCALYGLHICSRRMEPNRACTGRYDTPRCIVECNIEDLSLTLSPYVPSNRSQEDIWLDVGHDQSIIYRQKKSLLLPHNIMPSLTLCDERSKERTEE
jgi:hypothetical protein